MRRESLNRELITQRIIYHNIMTIFLKKSLTILSLFLFGIFSFSCHKKQLQEKPSHLISYDEIVELTAYSYIIESESLLAPGYSDSAKQAYSGQLYQCLFENHDISKDDYIVSLEFYLKDEDQANKLNEDVSIRLEKLRQEYTGEKEEKKD